MEFGLTQDEWMETAVAAAIAGGAIVAAFVLAAITTRIVHYFTHSTETDLDDTLGDAMRRPFVLFVAIWGVAIALETLSYIGNGSDLIRKGALALTVLVVTLTVRRVLVILLEWQAARPGTSNGKLHPGSIPLIRRGITILVFAAGFLIILDTLGVAISPLLAGLGIGGLAVALALQPLLANVFASSYMLSDSSIRIGDWVAIEGGPTGVVDDIGWRATRIRSFDNNVVIIPNSMLADSTVTNFSLTTLEADARVEVGVAYEEDLGRVEAVCTEVLTTLRDEWETSVKTHTPVVLFTAFGDSNVDVLLKMRSQTWSDSFALKHEMMKRIHARFTAEGITINYPARRLFLQSEDVDGLDRIAIGLNPKANGATEV
ncbi:MAG: mechanosensitive ion channel family protein [Dehalococcoidia bacterium]|nr:mechanosensitive ion channel family protein [Dehalococcoidia bacterium]MCB9483847.1 mechanosensitive ion channel family protein [Dehalococcoidia bacterium]MCB9491792.1 mechanosensitive ion channel family protein [Dehalococcoidia bacterium]